MDNEETNVLTTGNPTPMDEREQEVGNTRGTSSKGKIGKTAYASGGFAAGITTGAVGSTLAANYNKEALDTATEDVRTEPETPAPQDAIIATSEGVRVAQVNDDASFSEAFADARTQVGPGGVFEWHGRVYNTYYEDEWNNMNSTEKAGFQSKIDYNAVTDNDNSTTIHETVDSGTENQQTIDTETVQTDNQSDSAEIKVLGVEVVQNGEGQEMAVAALDIDGHNSIMVDVDMDGKMDILAIDANNNGQIDQGEAGNIQDLNISVSDLAQQAPESDIYLTQDDSMLNNADNVDIGVLL